MFFMPWLCGSRQLEAALYSTFMTLADLIFYIFLCDVLATRVSRNSVDDQF